ncbi:MAG: kelch repeat-containing protein [Bryobacteraceae bacterium]
MNWTDGKGHFWLFGGVGYDGSGNLGNLNDLWEFDPATNEWGWMGGSSTVGSGGGQPGVYGTLGTPSAGNIPGGRESSATWTDSSGNFWLFGGGMFYASGNESYLNDLWEFNPSTKEWAWMGGSSTVGSNCTQISGETVCGRPGVYGTQGTPSAGNIPGSRGTASSWIDSSGHFWLFGGYGYDANGTEGALNDLWEFNPATKEWTWIGGSSTVSSSGGQPGVYGTLGTPSAGNVPGARGAAASWTDGSGHLWLFGGQGFDAREDWGDLNDLWEFNPSTLEWAWMGGSNSVYNSAAYGTLGTPAAGNAPGGRDTAAYWKDSSGHSWLFGGEGYDANDNEGVFNDLWEFNPSTNEWAWMSGSSTFGSISDPSSSLYGQPGVYGTLGTPAAGNIPGGRVPGAYWTDSSGHFWLFGGQGFSGASSMGFLNDLWEYQSNLSATGPTLASLSPGSATAGGAGFTLTVNGSNFISGAAVNWASTVLVTTFVSATQLTAAVPASLIGTAGTVSVTVAETGGTSNALTFTIEQGGVSSCVYTVAPLAPSTVPATGGDVTIAIQTGAACGWSVSGLPGWITVAGSSSGTGPATVTMVVAVNTGTALSADVTIAGQIVVVAEAGAAAVGQGGIITTVAGGGSSGLGDGGPAISASLFFPSGVAVDAMGDLFIADQLHNAIRKVSRSGIITTVAGNGSQGFSGDGGLATSASLYDPEDVAVDASGNLFVADSGNRRVRKVSTNGIIATVAGNGIPSFSGDGGPAASASFDGPSGIAVDASGNLFIADSGDQRIRKVSTNGIITTVAGSGSLGFSGDGGPAASALLDVPRGVAVDALGNLFIADTDNQRIRKVSAGGIIATVAGDGTQGFSGDGGPATAAELNTPNRVAVDAFGNLFIADTDNQRIREVSAGGIVATVAGDGTGGFSGDGGPATSASLYFPWCVAVDGSGNLFIADFSNNRIREVLAPAPAAAAPSISPGGVVPVDSTVATIQPGEWISIYGANFASSTVTWNGNFPQSLGGASVTIDGKAAYLWYVGPGQINAQAPDDTALGPVQVAVTTPGGTASATVTLAQFAPSFLLFDGKHVAGIILRPNGSGAYGGGAYDVLGPTGTSLGYPTVAAKAGDTIELFAVGLGPTNPAVPAGQAFSKAAPTTNAVDLLINNASVTPLFAGLSGAGLYQINVTVSGGLGTGDVPLVATVGGAQTPPYVVISLQ